MSDLIDGLQYFHFLRPAWLALIPLAAWLWWRIRLRAGADTRPGSVIAPHLAAAMTVAHGSRRKIRPIDGTAVTLVLVSLAAAGPTWHRQPSPFVTQTAPLAIVVDLSESMLDTDVQPSRLERAQQKINELALSRAGARTALIAYAGTAHRVVPLTEDPEVLKPFIDSLEPGIMPQPGRNAAAALELAIASLAAEDTSGAILFVLDRIDPGDASRFEQHADADGPRVVFLGISRDRTDLDSLKSVPGAAVIPLTPDDADLRAIERRVAAVYREALASDDRLQWADQGWVLAWPAAMLMLLWFRRGWTMQWCVVLGVVWFSAQPGIARADGTVDWFLTPDQQGRLLFNDREYENAAATFQDPRWRGYALMQQGQYLEAAATFRRLDGADDAFAAGVAFIKGRAYRDGITAFETALQRDPAHRAAARNLEVARAILTYIEQTREQSGTEEGSEGADEVVFDSESEGGFEARVDTKTRLKIDSAEQWMRTVDTRTADFLRLRFQLEASRTDQ